MTTIISWDIGIKNLAFCQLQLSEPDEEGNGSYDISDWNVIDLNCISVSPPDIFPFLDTAFLVRYGKMNKKDLIPYCQQMNLPTDGNKNQIINTIQDKLHSLGWKPPTKKSLKPSLAAIGERLVASLQPYTQMLQAQHVLIENQPSLKNPIMKSIQMLVFSYFLLKGKIESNPGMNLHFISASNKLKIAKKSSLDFPTLTKTSKSKYTQTKNLGVLYCRFLLSLASQKHPYHDFFEGHTKKDDLSDSFLQAVYFMQKNYPKFSFLGINGKT